MILWILQTKPTVEWCTRVDETLFLFDQLDAGLWGKFALKRKLRFLTHRVTFSSMQILWPRVFLLSFFLLKTSQKQFRTLLSFKTALCILKTCFWVFFKDQGYGPGGSSHSYICSVSFSHPHIWISGQAHGAGLQGIFSTLEWGLKSTDLPWLPPRMS